MGLFGITSRTGRNSWRARSCPFSRPTRPVRGFCVGTFAATLSPDSGFSAAGARRPRFQFNAAAGKRPAAAHGGIPVQNLLVLLICLFAGLAVLVAVADRFGGKTDERTAARLRRWIPPLVGLLLVLSALDYFFGGP